MKNGKIYRHALPAAGKERTILAEAYVEPLTTMEEALAEIWSDVLKVKKVGVEDNFFDLGGDSLQATVVHDRLTREAQKSISITKLFEYPTVRSLASFLDSEVESAAAGIEQRQQWAEKRSRALLQQRRARRDA